MEHRCCRRELSTGVVSFRLLTQASRVAMATGALSRVRHDNSPQIPASDPGYPCRGARSSLPPEELRVKGLRVGAVMLSLEVTPVTSACVEGQACPHGQLVPPPSASLCQGLGEQMLFTDDCSCWISKEHGKLLVPWPRGAGVGEDGREVCK